MDFFACCQFGELQPLVDLYKYSTFHGRARLAQQRDSQQRTALHQAAESGHFHVVQWLVEVLGVDVNATDQLDWTALHSAARVGRTDICLYLISRGADVEVSSSSGCLALNYFIRHCDSRDRLELLAALTLLCPAREDLLALNDRGESLLHYACLNSSTNTETMVSFLMQNGVDPSVANNRGDLARDFLGASKKEELAALLGSGDGRDTDATPAMASMRFEKSTADGSAVGASSTPGEPQAPREIISFVTKGTEAENGSLLADLLAIKASLSGQPSAEAHKDLLQRIDNTVDALRPTGSALDAEHRYNLGARFAKALSLEVEVSLSNRTARKFRLEGKIMRCEKEGGAREYLYFFLFTDVLVLFDEARIKARKIGEEITVTRSDMTLLCLDELTVFDIPEACGMLHGLQIVADPANTITRSSCTYLLPSAEQKTELLNLLQAHIQQLNENFDIDASGAAFPEADAIRKEGFLVKQGLVVNNFQRVYVRYTGEELYYYPSEASDTPIGALDLEGLVVKFDNKKNMLRWCDVKRGRSANFCALSTSDYKEWKAAVVGKGAEINSSNAITEQAPISGAASLTVVVHSGRDLTPMDVNGKSDPYCIIGLCTTTGEWLKGAKRKKTPVIRKTLHPHWKKGNKFTLASPDPSYGIRIDVWDEDRLKKDDFMGLVFITQQELLPSKPLTKWFPLLPMPGKEEANDKIQGDLYVSVTVARI